jgi:hypothetical protein
MTLKTDRQTKGADVSAELTPDEIAYIKDQYRRKGGAWPRSGFPEAVNPATPSSELAAKSARHLELERELTAAEATLRTAQRAVYEQERAASKADRNGPFNTEPFIAPATEARVEAEALVAGARARLTTEEARYKVRQRRALLGIPEPNLVARGLRALGLD